MASCKVASEDDAEKIDNIIIGKVCEASACVSEGNVYAVWGEHVSTKEIQECCERLCMTDRR